MQVKSIAESFKGSILQYFLPSLSYHLSFRPLFCLFLSGCVRQVFLYKQLETVVHVCTVKPVLSCHSKKKKMVFKTDYRLMQVKSIADCWSKVLQNALLEHSAILSTCIKVPSVFKTFVLSVLSGRLRQVLLYRE